MGYFWFWRLSSFLSIFVNIHYTGVDSTYCIRLSIIILWHCHNSHRISFFPLFKKNKILFRNWSVVIWKFIFFLPRNFTCHQFFSNFSRKSVIFSGNFTVNACLLFTETSVCANKVVGALSLLWRHVVRNSSWSHCAYLNSAFVILSYY